MTDFAHGDPSSVARPPSRPSGSLAGTRLLSSRFLSAEDREALQEATGPVRTVGAGTDLLREGERADTLFFVTRGWACRFSMTRDGGRQIPTLLLPGDVGNLDSLMLEQLDYGVRTLTEVAVVPLSRDRALALAAQHPGIARTFTWLALIENVTLSKWALSLGRRSSRERLAHLLCELSVRLGGETGDRSSFPFPLTQEVLADTLGLTAVHVNRMLQSLRTDGLVVTGSRTMTLPNVMGLRRIAGFDPRYLHLESRAA